jgi:hypothetical protein
MVLNVSSATFYENGWLNATVTTQLPSGTENVPWTDYIAHAGTNHATDWAYFTYTHNIPPTITYLTEESGVGDNSPTSTLSLPTDDTLSLPTTITFECNGTDDSQLSNVTWYLYNITGDEINSTEEDWAGTSNSSTFQHEIPDLRTNYTWNCLVYDNASQSDWGNSNFTLQIDNKGFLENSITYNNVVSSGSTQDFVLNMTYDNNYYTGISVQLTYNNTNHSTTQSGSGSDLTFTGTISVTSVDSAENKSFYFDVALTNSSGTYYYQSTVNNQSVSPISIDNCALNNQTLFNITMYDEETLTRINGTMEVLFNFYSLGDNSNVYTYNDTLTYDTGSHTQICVNNLTDSYRLSYNIAYYGNVSHYKRYKIIQNMIITNETTLQNINLYNLLSNVGNEFRIDVVGSLYTSNAGLLIDAQRQYLSLDQFISIENSETDSDGEGVLHLIPADEVYNFIVSYNGQVVGTFNNYKVQCQNPSTEQCTIVLNLGSVTSTITDFTSYDEVSLGYLLDRDNFILYTTFNSLDGEVHTIEQYLIEDDGFGNTTICTDTAIGTSGTITCNIPTAYRNTSFFSEVYVDGEYHSTKFFSLGTGLPDFNMYGVDILIQLLMFSTLVLLFIAHPILIVVGAMLGLLLSIILIYVSDASFGTIISLFIFYLVAGVVIIWQIRRISR